MSAKRLLTVTAAVLVGACGGNASLRANASGDVSASSAKAEAGAEAGTSEGEPATTAADTEKGAGQRAGAERPEPEAPSHDPRLVRQALDASGAAPPDERARLGLRLVIVEQGPEQPWLLAVVNRGTEAVLVTFDLRTLTLEITPPAPPEDPDPKRRRRAAPKAPKPVVCELPAQVVPKSEAPELEARLEPGEGLVDTFDPRLYCLPTRGKSPFVPGASVVARLGFPEKTKAVWRKGKKEKVVLEQAPPFIARIEAIVEPLGKAEPGAEPAKAEPKKPAKAAGEVPESGIPESDRVGVKQVLANAVVLGSDYEEPAPRAREPPPLSLAVTRGSDARTEREATVTVALANRGKRAQKVYFRRELVSYELAGPTGFVSCDAGPDDRSPDRTAFTTLRPGGRVSATSRLIELCPPGALRAPGLYLVRARYEAAPSTEPGENVFRGRVLSEKPATVRVRQGWGDLAAQRAPMRVRVGGGAVE